MSANPSEPEIEISADDIQFDCDHCGKNLVVNRHGEGLRLPCPHCGIDIIVPPYTGDPRLRQAAEEAAKAIELPKFDFSVLTPEELGEKLESVQSRIKENASQRTEAQNNINRTTIQMHRLTLQMQKLQQRLAVLDAEQAALNAAKEKKG